MPIAASSSSSCCRAPTPSGKDGTIRGVFGEMIALGVRAVGFKAPSDIERAHDFLWRIHSQVPVVGEFAIFNRSHYEDGSRRSWTAGINRRETSRAIRRSTISSGC